MGFIDLIKREKEGNDEKIQTSDKSAHRKVRYTPDNIESLEDGEIFVFGSNLSGYHVGGAAKVAVKKFGAVYGKAEGMQGQSYAIPTVYPNIEMIKPHVDKFIRYAEANQELTFLVSPIGCGNAGFTAFEIAPLFIRANRLKNVVLPESFVYIIKNLICNPAYSFESENGIIDYYDKGGALDSPMIRKKTDPKTSLVKIFQETVCIANTGYYKTGNGNIVELPNNPKMAGNTAFYSKEFNVEKVPPLEEETIIEVTDQDCLLETIRLSKEGYFPAVLNMASRQNPGGGVLKGSRAQEESIFRRTDIFKSLYQFIPYAGSYGVALSQHQYPLDPNFGGIYSPNVILFRHPESKGCEFLEKPEFINVISVAAMRHPELNSSGYISYRLIKGVKNKMRTIFRIALRHRHDALVLGAWGCGAYQNPPRHIAALFNEVLDEKEFKNKFRKIVFAIIEDHNSNKSHNPEGNLLPFKEEFGCF